MTKSIQERVMERGGVRFRDFMEMALYDAEHGYYGAGRARLGRAGDYFTSVSVGKVFGELMGMQFLEMWEVLGRPGGFTIVEQGAHDGTFAADVLGWCREQAPHFFAGVRYEIVEGLEALRARQRERLEGFQGKVGWREGLDELPRFTGVHFSNELVDAFPVHLVRFRDGCWRELYVTEDLGWREVALEAGTLLEALGDVPRLEGYTTEVNLAAGKWAAGVAGKIERGWVLVIDYGYPRSRYYAPARTGGTLECYAGHARGIDPLARPGFCDLTAHVEFTSLARAFLTGGMTFEGYADQGHFLTGIVAKAFAERGPSVQEARGLKTLLHPEMMGRVFQVLALGRGVEEQRVAGFRFERRGGVELEIA